MKSTQNPLSYLIVFTCIACMPKQPALSHLLEVVYELDRGPVAKLVQRVYTWEFPIQTGFGTSLSATCKRSSGFTKAVSIF